MEHINTQSWALSDYNFGTEITDWCSLVLIKVMRGQEHIGYVFVIDRRMGNKAKYKLPGGHNTAGETPHDTAMRETLGESGVAVTDLKLVDKWEQKNTKTPHWKCLFVGELSESRSMSLNSQESENEGEEAEFFTIDEFQNLVREKNFLGDHYNQLVYTKLIETIPEVAAA